ncbi:MAG: protein kinase [Planctomycetes bacterium]|nr:protein kinase [Planctomycetota bacterium]
MNSDREIQLRRIFNIAFELPISERSLYLDKECRGDAELRRRLDAMLAAAGEGVFLADPTHSGATSTLATPLSECPGTRIGNYKLLQQIGEGGFGTVFMAEQETPVRRRVALKVIKLGMDTRHVIARFEAERQALAMMDHPNIARVLDAGATESGRPYFVMELVKGVPITEYCDRNHLTARERLELMIPVCQAVQHAHHKGIIHRDIKPANILVTLHDGKPVPKVIDFGIAKATEHRLTAKTLFTEHNAFIGTPMYMSPEQAELSGLDVDARTDVYSLGVLLYELLTGTTPFRKEDLLAAGYLEMQRIIREVEPQKPSTRVSTLGDSLTNVAGLRRVEPGKLGLLLRGDMDWIVMRCLEKDRTRRYDTPTSLADDLRRHLAGEAVVAAPPSVNYRMRKFIARNRRVVIAISVIAAVLILGLIGTSTGMAWALSEKDIAVIANANARKAESIATEKSKEAEVQRKRAEYGVYVANIQAADAAAKIGDSSTLRVLLDRCSPEFRGWEWKYLQAASDQSLSTISLFKANTRIVPTPDPTKILALCGGNQTISLVSTEDFHTLYTLSLRKGTTLSWKGDSNENPEIEISHDGKRLWAHRWSSNTGPTHLYDFATGREITAFQSAELSAEEAVFSPDSRFLATTDWLLTIASLWRSEDGSRVASPDFAPEKPRGSAFSADSSIWIVGTTDGILHLFDSARGEPIRQIQASRYGIDFMSSSPNGNYFFTGFGNGSFAVWDSHNFSIVCQGTNYTGVRPGDFWNRTLIVWTPETDGFARLLAPADSRMTLFELPSGKAVDHAWKLNALESLQFAPDNDTFAAIEHGGTSRSQALMHTAGELEKEMSGMQSSLSCMCLSPDSKYLLCGTVDGTIRIWDRRGTQVRTLLGHATGIESLFYLGDGKSLISCDWNGTIKIWDPAAGAPVNLEFSEDDDGEIFTDLKFTSNGSRILGGQSDVVQIWDTLYGKQIAKYDTWIWFEDPDGIRNNREFLTISGDGNRIAAGNTRLGADVLDADTGYPLARLHWPGVKPRLPLDGGRPFVVLSGDLSRVALWFSSQYESDDGKATGGITIYSTSDGTTIRSFPDINIRFPDNPDFAQRGSTSVALDGSGARLFFTNGRSMHALDVATGQDLYASFLQDNNAQFSNCESLSFEPNREWMATTHYDEPARIWDMGRLQLVGKLLHSKSIFGNLEMSPDGNRCLGQSSGRFRLWDALTGTELLSFPDFRSEFVSARFDTSGGRVVIQPDLGTRQIFDSVPFSERRRQQQSYDAAIPDGRRACSAALVASGNRIRLATDAIRADKSLSTTVRAAALDTLRDICSERRARIRALFDEHVFEAQVQQAIHNDTKLDIGEKADLSEIAKFRGDSPVFLKNAALARLSKRDSTPEQFQIALNAARQAATSLPDDEMALTSLGLAYYSTGNFADAIVSLEKSDVRRNTKHYYKSAMNLAALAMSQFKMGKTDEARTLFAQLQKLFEDPASIPYLDLAKALFTEAQILIHPESQK